MQKLTQRNLAEHHSALFSGCSALGPSSPEDLLAQLYAAGMTAAAWKVEGMIEQQLDDLERLEELERRVSELENDLENARKTDPELDALRAFFDECFESLDHSYPARDVFDSYDKSVIYDAIRKGEFISSTTN